MIPAAFPRLIYAKKLRLPAQAAHVLQSLHMALALGAAGADIRCFPGCEAPEGYAGPAGLGREAGLLAVLRTLKQGEIPTGWRVLSGAHKGRYGLEFRWAVLRAALAAPESFCYARDLGEMRYLCALSRFLPLRLVYEAHEVLYSMRRANGKSGWERTRVQEQGVFRRISGLIALSPQVAEEVRRDFGYTGPVLVEPNGYAASLFSPLPLFTPEHPWPEHPWPEHPCPERPCPERPCPEPAGRDDPARIVRLVYVGSFAPGKGVRTLLGALALLPKRFHLRLVGGGPAPALEELRELARRLELGERVALYGSVPPEAVRAACAGAHIFVLPQQSAFFFSPLKLYEGMAMGLPVVTSSLPLFESHARAGRVLAAPGPDKEGLASALRTLAASRELAAGLREQGLREAAQHTWQERARRILQFMAALPASSRAHGAH